MVTLYTTHCPKCEILEKKLKQKNINYKEITDINIMIEKGFTSTPMLELDGIVMDFSVANTWINIQEQGELDEY